MSSPFKWFLEVWDDILVYALTLLGVLVAQYLPAFKAGTDFDLTTRWPHVIVGAVIALMFVLQDETTGGTDAGVKTGKRKNLRRRLSHGLAQGVSWATLTA